MCLVVSIEQSGDSPSPACAAAGRTAAARSSAAASSSPASHCSAPCAPAHVAAALNIHFTKPLNNLPALLIASTQYKLAMVQAAGKMSGAYPPFTCAAGRVLPNQVPRTSRYCHRYQMRRNHGGLISRDSPPAQLPAQTPSAAGAQARQRWTKARAGFLAAPPPGPACQLPAWPTSRRTDAQNWQHSHVSRHDAPTKTLRLARHTNTPNDDLCHQHGISSCG